MPQAIGNLSETMVTAIIGATTVQQRWTISIDEETNTRKAKGNSSNGEGSGKGGSETAQEVGERIDPWPRSQD